MSTAVIKTYPKYDEGKVYHSNVDSCPSCNFNDYYYKRVTEYIGGTPSSTFDTYWVAENRICKSCGCKWYVQYRVGYK